jgi:hypothetical protein
MRFSAVAVAKLQFCNSLILSVLAGIQMLLVGFGIMKANWKTEALKRKYEKRLKTGGAIILFGGIVRIILGIILTT